MQESLYQTEDARNNIRQRMQETLYQTADSGDYFRQRVSINERMQETLDQTADARVSILEPRCKRRVEGIGMQRSCLE